MMKKFFLLILIISVRIISAYSQSSNIIYIWNNILSELCIPENYSYDNLESIVSDNKNVLSIEVAEIRNRHDGQYIDSIYTLHFINYSMVIYKSEYSQSYLLARIDIYLDKYKIIRSFFPDYSISEYRINEEFGEIIEEMSSDEVLVYATKTDSHNIIWNFISLFFTDDKMEMVRLIFRFE